MNGRTIGTVTVFGLVCVVLVFLEGGGIWSPVMVIESTIPESLHTDNTMKMEMVDFEKMRRDALRDPHAVFLDQQTTPPFDAAFKNPCWWYGTHNASLACLPFFYLAGFPKSGTTDLYLRLTKHPLIIGASVKEPHYVTRGQFGRRTQANKIASYGTVHRGHTSWDILRYSTTFFNTAQARIRKSNISGTIDSLIYDYDGDAKTNKMFKYPAITVDASASTAWDNSRGHHIIRDVPLPYRVLASNASIIDWVLRMNPDVRFVVIMRDPISRAYSGFNFFRRYQPKSAAQFDANVDAYILHYNQCIRSGRAFVDCTQLAKVIAQVRLHIGMYHVHIQELLARVPRERIHAVRSEDYHQNMAANLARIFDFLELPQLTETKIKDVCGSRQKNVNHNPVEPMLPSTRRKLMEFYQPYNEKLAKLLGNDAFLWKDIYSKSQTPS